MQAIVPQSRYPGKKAAMGQWQKIISEIPKCEIFIEAFAGSGYISSLLAGRINKIVLNDIDKSVIGKIKVERNANVELHNKDYRKLIALYDGKLGTVFYFDPPYLVETRSYKFRIYKHDWHTTNEHKQFLKAIKAMKSPCIVSHYPCALYDNSLKNWRKISYKSMTRAGIRIENIYMNFRQPVLLQCFQHIGENFTDRQRIKRKVERLIKRLHNEHPQERAAILSSVIDSFSYVGSRIQPGI